MKTDEQIKEEANVLVLAMLGGRCTELPNEEVYELGLAKEEADRLSAEISDILESLKDHVNNRAARARRAKQLAEPRPLGARAVYLKTPKGYVHEIGYSRQLEMVIFTASTALAKSFRSKQMAENFVAKHKVLGAGLSGNGCEFIPCNPK